MTFSCKLEPKLRLRTGASMSWPWWFDSEQTVTTNRRLPFELETTENKGFSANFRRGNISLMQVEVTLHLEPLFLKGPQAGYQIPSVFRVRMRECGSPWSCSLAHDQALRPLTITEWKCHLLRAPCDPSLREQQFSPSERVSRAPSGFAWCFEKLPTPL